MRYFPILAGIALALAAFAPSAAQTAKPFTYQVTYNNQDLGTWDLLQRGRNPDGTYDGSSFDSNHGPGYPTLQLTRPMTAQDRSSLVSSLPPANGELVVTTLRNGVAVTQTTCPQSTVSDFGTNGDPGTGTEEITFACTSIAIQPAPKS